MTVFEAIVQNAEALSQLNSREEVYAFLTKKVSGSEADFRKATEDMNFLYKVLKGIFEDGKEKEARKLFEVIKKVVDTRMPK